MDFFNSRIPGARVKASVGVLSEPCWPSEIVYLKGNKYLYRYFPNECQYCMSMSGLFILFSVCQQTTNSHHVHVSQWDLGSSWLVLTGIARTLWDTLSESLIFYLFCNSVVSYCLEEQIFLYWTYKSKIGYNIWAVGP